MSFKRVTVVLGILSLVLLQWGCNSNPDPSKSITRVSVKSHLETLSSDDMRGRHALDEGAEKAADYIAKNFKKIGLKPLEGDEDFFQEFMLHQFKSTSISLTINDRSIKDEHVLVVSGAEHIQWDEDSELETIHIGKDDAIGQVFSRIKQGNGDMLVTVDPVHAKMFSRYKYYFDHRNYSVDGQDKDVKIMVLSAQSASDELVVDIKMSRKDFTMKNVVGTIPGKREDEFIIYSAHYDHIGVISPVEGDSIANGADDDASGTVGVIELANHFSQHDKPERTLMFVAFTGEEMGMLGSKYFSKTVEPDEIIAMVNIEMIGKPSRFGPNSAFITGFDESDFGSILQSETKDFDFEFHPDPYTEQNLFYRSDNATLARLGVPAHTISTDQIDIDSLYHTVNDEIESLDIDHMTQTIRGVALGTQPLVNGSETPTRVDRQRLN